MTFVTILSVTMTVFLIVAVGFISRRLKLVTDESEQSLMRLFLNVFYPCFILSKVPGNESLRNPSVVVTAFTIGLLMIIVSFAVTYLVGRLIRIGVQSELNTFCVATALQNYGFIPIPLIAGIFPDEADQILGVLFVHNLGLEIALWTLGIVIISGTVDGAWRRLINGPTISIGMGLILNFTGLYFYIPEFVTAAIQFLGNCSIPVGLILVGVTLCGVLERERWINNWRLMFTASVVRFVVLPAVILSTALIPGLSHELKRVLLVQAAMPCAIFPIVLAKYYGGSPGIAVQISLATSLLCLLMTPLLLALGVWILGSN